jgi:pimeloyl-ACP methyl ester carboxylesterase
MSAPRYRRDVPSDVDTDATRPSAVGVDGFAPGRGRSIGWIVVVSVLTGLVGSAVLTLVVFAGAREHIITASALLAYAVGWALLATLSARFTEQPQRWAIVPAASMALTGVGIVLFARSNSVMQALGWFWPPLLLVLAVWTTTQVRRHLHSWSRWLLYPVLAFLVLASVGGAVETLLERSDRSNNAMPGEMVDVGGRQMHIHCTGSGSPTVVLQPGLGEMSSALSLIAPAVAKNTRVCVYDRAGRGWSESASGAQDGDHIAADLHTLLPRARVPGPYVLAGHSFGGLYVLAFAAHYSDEVAGMVLIDSTPPDAFTSLPDYPGFYSAFRRVGALRPTVARFGVGRLIVASQYGDLPRQARTEARASASTARLARSSRDEFATAPRSMEQAKAFRSFGGKPLIVLTASDGNQAGWRAAQDRLATLSTNSLHRIISGATHDSLVSDKVDAARVSQAIADVVRAIRDSAALVGP